VKQLLPVLVVWAQLLRLSLELLPRHFVGESRSNCSEIDFPQFLLVL
jgi:hypothetical protein